MCSSTWKASREVPTTGMRTRERHRTDQNCAVRRTLSGTGDAVQASSMFSSTDCGSAMIASTKVSPAWSAGYDTYEEIIAGCFFFSSIEAIMICVYIYLVSFPFLSFS